MTTRADNVVTPELFDMYRDTEIPHIRNATRNSTAVEQSPMITAMANGPSYVFTVPVYDDFVSHDQAQFTPQSTEYGVDTGAINPLTGTDEYGSPYAAGSTTSPSNNIQPRGLSASPEMGFKVFRAFAVETNDLTDKLMGTAQSSGGPSLREEAMRKMLRAEMTSENQIVHSIFNGVFNSMATKYAALGVRDPFTLNPLNLGNPGVTMSTLFDAEALLGENFDATGLFVCSSRVHAEMKKQDLIQYERDSTSNLRIEFYNERRVIVDNQIATGADIWHQDAVTLGNAGAGATNVHQAFLLGPGFLRYGEANTIRVAEVRNELGSGGAGGYTRLLRQENAYHVPYMSFAGSPNPLNGDATTAGTIQSNGAFTFDETRKAREAVPGVRILFQI